MPVTAFRLLQHRLCGIRGHLNIRSFSVCLLLVDESINSLVSYVRKHYQYSLLSVAEVNSSSDRDFDLLRWLAGATFGLSLQGRLRLAGDGQHQHILGGVLGLRFVNWGGLA